MTIPVPNFNPKLRVIVDTAAELDMKLFLQAGYMPEEVPGLPPSAKDLAKRDAKFLAMTAGLSLSGCIFDYGDERSIERDGGVENGSFRIGKMAYDTVVLPDLIELQNGTLERIRAFANQGGRVIVLGAAPCRFVQTKCVSV